MAATAPSPFTTADIQRAYDRAAPWYDALEWVIEWCGLRRLRRQLLQRAAGKVLEVAAGTGKNFPWYPRGCSLTAGDLTPGMLRLGARRAARLRLSARLYIADAEYLPFAARTFDTVVSSLSACTFLDPAKAYHEMKRVCRAQGRILLLEHGRSDRCWLGRWMDHWEFGPGHSLGCHWNREPQQLVREGGLRVVHARRYFLGIYHLIEAAAE